MGSCHLAACRGSQTCHGHLYLQTSLWSSGVKGAGMAPLAVVDVHSWTDLVLDEHLQLPSAWCMQAVFLGAVVETGLPGTNIGSRFVETENRKSCIEVKISFEGPTKVPSQVLVPGRERRARKPWDRSWGSAGNARLCCEQWKPKWWIGAQRRWCYAYSENQRRARKESDPRVGPEATVALGILHAFHVCQPRSRRWLPMSSWRWLWKKKGGRV